MPNRIDYRSPELVLGILSYVDEADEKTPTPEPEVVEVFESDAFTRKTVETTIYDLRRFGALYRAGGSARARRHPTLRLTDLGRSWLSGELPPLPGRAPVEYEEGIVETELPSGELVRTVPTS